MVIITQSGDHQMVQILCCYNLVILQEKNYLNKMSLTWYILICIIMSSRRLHTLQALDINKYNIITLLEFGCSVEVNNLGVTFDSDNSFDNHVAKVCRACYYHLRDL